MDVASPVMYPKLAPVQSIANGNASSPSPDAVVVAAPVSLKNLIYSKGESSSSSADMKNRPSNWSASLGKFVFLVIRIRTVSVLFLITAFWAARTASEGVPGDKGTSV